MIKKYITFLFIIIFSLNIYSQDEEIRITTLSDSVLNNCGASKLIFETDIIKAKEYAFRDIENNTPLLLINGGIAPSFSFDQLDFEKKYKVYYYRFGCSFPDNEIAKTYNFIILDYIENKLGDKCIKEISNDVFGLKEWKKLKIKH